MKVILAAIAFLGVAIGAGLDRPGVALEGRAPYSDATSYTTVTTWEDCTSEPTVTRTSSITKTTCPLCTSSIPPTSPPVHTTIYTTVYTDICSTGFTKTQYLVTETCTGSTPSFPPRTSNYMPPGFTKTVTVCTVCGTKPVTATLTVPCTSSTKKPPPPPPTYYTPKPPPPPPKTTKPPIPYTKNAAPRPTGGFEGGVAAVVGLVAAFGAVAL